MTHGHSHTTSVPSWRWSLCEALGFWRKMAAACADAALLLQSYLT